MDLDRTNKRILAMLEANGRLSAAAIGREIGLSRTAVQDRIAGMEQRGTISGYHAAIEDGPGLVRAVLFVGIAERPCDKALRWLASLEGVTAVLSLSGEVDAVVSAVLPGVEALSALNDRVAQSPMISAVRSQVVLRRYGAGGG
ncbi:Lrp/AsnC family transcriptional regulator [Paracoccus marinus]|uniref:Lrp/AsnC family transcriptional regulator n=1 Tax=Paracoccus marinus TaxID=288426 RepID=UPI00103D9308|nr:Lrp/AsnC family transcriptional regulator [Paracoccus marinus]GLS81344.1 transcriptional regulator [Paracoccus marinus]